MRPDNYIVRVSLLLVSGAGRDQIIILYVFFFHRLPGAGRDQIIILYVFFCYRLPGAGRDQMDSGQI